MSKIKNSMLIEMLEYLESYNGESKTVFADEIKRRFPDCHTEIVSLSDGTFYQVSDIYDWIFKKYKPTEKNICIKGEVEFSDASTIVQTVIDMIEELDKIRPFIDGKEDLEEVAPELYINLMTYGGEVDAANAIISSMELAKSKGIKVTTRAFGIAASSGMLIFMHGEKRIFSDNDYTMLMWHKPKVTLKGISVDKAYNGVNNSISKFNVHEKYLLGNTEVTERMLLDLYDDNWYIRYNEAFALDIVTE